MAKRRMFSPEITSSSEFLMMSQSAQNLYFHIGMNADDDGFCEIFTVMRMTESKPDDLTVLHTKGFIYVVSDKVCIVVDWHTNNQLRADRYKKSRYLDDPEFREIYLTIMKEKVENIDLYRSFLLGKPNGNQREPQVRLGKVSIDKVSIDKKNTKNSVTHLSKKGVIKKLSNDLQVEEVFVKEEVEKMRDWLKANGKKYKDYEAFARNWIRRAKAETTKGRSGKGFVL
jgi:hypothetical protein